MPDGAQVDDGIEEAGLDSGASVDAGETGCLGCGLVADSPAELFDGTVVCTSCPQYRHECEVRYVAAMETKAHRSAYLVGVVAKRGRPAATRIVEGLCVLYAREGGQEWGRSQE